jgi:hypothetical protein
MAAVGSGLSPRCFKSEKGRMVPATSMDKTDATSTISNVYCMQWADEHRSLKAVSACGRVRMRRFMPGLGRSGWGYSEQKMLP